MSGKSIVPRHVAIIMDGNGRWAQRRGLPRIEGHRQGAKSLRKAIDFCLQKDIEALTVFAFSTENWKRPQEEVDFLLDTLLTTLEKEAQALHEKQVSLHFVGAREGFSSRLQEQMGAVEKMTAENEALKLTLAVDYGGRWDILQAAKHLAKDAMHQQVDLDKVDESAFGRYFSLQALPPLDLLIRTSGDVRVSNFLLWDLAYAELYFTKAFWPDFAEEDFEKALQDFALRERRYGLTGEQLLTDEETL